MQSKYLYHNIQENVPYKRLIMFFAGWGMDEKPFRHIKSENYDIIIFYNYSRFGFGECVTPFFNLFNTYSQIHIIAYSMGVWGASVAFEKFLDSLDKSCSPQMIHRIMKKIDRRIAINGTLFPVNNIWGIPHDIFTKTIENLPRGMDKFILRMCGNKEIYSGYQQCLPERSAEDIKQELISVKENFYISNSLKWNKAIISAADNIFPTGNQLTFWEDYKISTNPRLEIKEIPGGHYPFSALTDWEEVLNL